MKDRVDTDFAVMHEDELTATIWYPRAPTEPGMREHPRSVVVDLCCVRAADPIRVTYDFDRDGWKIEQAQRFTWHAGDEECDPCWKEVSFIQAWGSEDKDWKRQVCGPEDDR
jgi:hypothetical protein